MRASGTPASQCECVRSLTSNCVSPADGEGVREACMSPHDRTRGPCGGNDEPSHSQTPCSPCQRCQSAAQASQRE